MPDQGPGVNGNHGQEARQAQPEQRGHGGQLGAGGRALLHEVESGQDGDQRQRGAPVALVQLGRGGVGREELVTKLRPTKQFNNKYDSYIMLSWPTTCSCSSVENSIRRPDSLNTKIHRQSDIQLSPILIWIDIDNNDDNMYDTICCLLTF